MSKYKCKLPEPFQHYAESEFREKLNMLVEAVRELQGADDEDTEDTPEGGDSAAQPEGSPASESSSASEDSGSSSGSAAKKAAPRKAASKGAGS